MMKHAAAAAGTVPVTQLFVAVAIAAIIYFAAVEATAGAFDVAEFMGFISATGLLLQPLKRLTGVNEQLQKGLAACESVFGLVDEAPEEDRGTVALERAKGAIRFQDVSLTYRGASRPALDGVERATGRNVDFLLLAEFHGSAQAPRLFADLDVAALGHQSCFLQDMSLISQKAVQCQGKS